jgi:hypothetical protein
MQPSKSPAHPKPSPGPPRTHDTTCDARALLEALTPKNLRENLLKLWVLQ